jgi:hypothetical protein
MRRRIVAGGCALIGAALAVAGACSYLIIPSMTLSCFDHDVFVLHFYDGRVRLFWFHSPVEPIRAEAAEYQAILFVESQSGPSPSADDGVYGPPAPPAFRVPITIGNRYNVPPLGGGWRLKIDPQPSPRFSRATVARRVELCSSAGLGDRGPADDPADPRLDP